MRRIVILAVLSIVLASVALAEARACCGRGRRGGFGGGHGCYGGGYGGGCYGGGCYGGGYGGCYGGGYYGGGYGGGYYGGGYGGGYYGGGYAAPVSYGAQGYYAAPTYASQQNMQPSSQTPAPPAPPAPSKR